MVLQGIEVAFPSSLTGSCLSEGVNAAVVDTAITLTRTRDRTWIVNYRKAAMTMT